MQYTLETADEKAKRRANTAAIYEKYYGKQKKRDTCAVKRRKARS